MWNDCPFPQPNYCCEWKMPARISVRIHHWSPLRGVESLWESIFSVCHFRDINCRFYIAALHVYWSVYTKKLRHQKLMVTCERAATSGTRSSTASNLTINIMLPACVCARPGTVSCHFNISLYPEEEKKLQTSTDICTPKRIASNYLQTLMGPYKSS